MDQTAMRIVSYVSNALTLDMRLTAHEVFRLNELLEIIYPEICKLNLSLTLWYRQDQNQCQVQKFKDFSAENLTVQELLRLIQTLELKNIGLRNALHPLHFNCLYQLLTTVNPFISRGVQLCLVDRIIAGNWRPCWCSIEAPDPRYWTLERLKEQGVDVLDYGTLIQWQSIHGDIE